MSHTTIYSNFSFCCIGCVWKSACAEFLRKFFSKKGGGDAANPRGPREACFVGRKTGVPAKPVSWGGYAVIRKDPTRRIANNLPKRRCNGVSNTP